MNVYLRLFVEFFKTGLFAVGGGMATLPFLQEMGERTGWFTYGDLMNMLAISESTPGPIGINMATYVGYTTAGLPGAIVATVGEVTPCIIVILIVAAVLNSFRTNRYVERAFYGLRPASTALICAAGVAVVLEVLTSIRLVDQGMYNTLGISGGNILNWKGLLLAAVVVYLTNFCKKTKGWHPIVFIALSAAAGVAFGFAG